MLLRKQISGEQKTPTETILEVLFPDNTALFSKKDAIDKVLYLLDMLTPNQKLEVSKKIERCNYFIERAVKGMDISKIKSLVSRNFDIDRTWVDRACKPCEIRFKSIK